MDLLNAIAPYAERGALVFLRVSGAFFFFPLFGGNAVPNIVKVLLVMAITMALVPVIPAPTVAMPVGLWQWAAGGLREFLAGLVMSFAMLFLFAGVQLAGQLIDFQMGFGVVNVLDPSTDVQIPVMGLFHFVIAILIFLVVGGHRMVLTAIVESFQVAPLLEPTLTPAIAQHFINAFGALFVEGIKLAAPVLVTLVVYTATIGMVAKTVPTINLLIVGFPIRISLGLFAVAAGLPVFGPLFQRGILGLIADLRTIAQAMG